jgi:site-specific DNA-methyltransferase (adenine-specific)
LRGKNPGNVWDIATKAHHGNEHFAIFPEELVERIVKFATQKGDWVMDPFSGRGTTGIICKNLKRRFVGIDLYPNNISLSERNIQNV